MILGLDYFHTITDDFKRFKELARVVKADGGQVFIISALSELSNENAYQHACEAALKREGFPYTRFIVVRFKENEDIPHLKFEVAVGKGVELFFDDRQDVVDYFNLTGIYAFPAVRLDKKGKAHQSRQVESRGVQDKNIYAHLDGVSRREIQNNERFSHVEKGKVGRPPKRSILQEHGSDPTDFERHYRSPFRGTDYPGFNSDGHEDQ